MQKNIETFITDTLHKKGMRMTRPKKKFLDFFTSEEYLKTPQELLENIKQHNIDIGLTTVYRMLNYLMEAGLTKAYSINGELRYIFCPPDHHYHMICVKCLRVKNIFDCPVKDVKVDGFKIQSHQVDFFGICDECSKKEVNK